FFFFFFFFFFQAEDGIRDFHVTGVQTCALPISSFVFLRVLCGKRVLVVAGKIVALVQQMFHVYSFAHRACKPILAAIIDDAPDRSEERRVGKECRDRWETYACRKKMKG